MAEPLSKEGVRNACNAFIEINNFLSDLKQRNKHAECIKNPRLPELISESIVYHVIKEKRCILLKKLNYSKIRFNKKAKKYIGGKQKATDIILDLDDGTECLIEIKATQVKYTEIKEKDAQADYIIWVDFNDAFRTGTNKSIQFSILKVPINMTAKQYNWKPYHKKYKSAKVIIYENLDEILD